MRAQKMLMSAKKITGHFRFLKKNEKIVYTVQLDNGTFFDLIFILFLKLFIFFDLRLFGTAICFLCAFSLSIIKIYSFIDLNK